MLKTNTQIKKTIFTAVFAVLMIPTLVSAGSTGSYDSGSWDGGGWGSWGGNSPTYDYTYTPNYSYTPSYSSPSYYGSSYGSSYTPSYSSPSYSNYSSYTLPTYNSSYSYSSIPNTNYVSSDNKNTNTSSSSARSNSNSTSSSNQNQNSTSGASSTATGGAGGSATSSTGASTSGANATGGNSSAVNNNVNNLYVYTNPTGNAVVYNPQHQVLNVYCTITPSNPRVGQTVTATAYATGGIGNYTYTWGGDINAVSGASTSFTSYTTGTKNITVTVRSDQEIVTKSCNVTFESNNYVYGNYYNSYTPSYTGGSSVNLTPGITSGTPVSGVYLSQLPATGLSLSFFDYMVATMVVILGVVFTFIYQARKRLTVENI